MFNVVVLSSPSISDTFVPVLVITSEPECTVLSVTVPVFSVVTVASVVNVLASEIDFAIV